MNKKIIALVFIFLFTVSLSQVEAAEQEKSFRIMTESDSGDYIGQNESWNFSDENNANITIYEASDDVAVFITEDFEISNMRFEFGSEEGEVLEKGLYTPAKRFPFRGSYNGINISGDGRGCNKILGAFYVHEYVTNDGELEKAAIDFVQICEPNSSNVESNNQPKLYGSLRYNSKVSDSCNSQGCAEVRENLGIEEYEDTTNQTTTNESSTTSNTQSIVTSTSDLPKADAHKAIVEINTYTLDSDYALTPVSSGSGIIIDPSGIVLTNYHVIAVEDSFDDTMRDASYVICVTEEIDEEPECYYTGSLIESDKDLDIALLQINNIPSLTSKDTFSYLNLNSSDTTNVNDEVTVLGYPSIGGDTITITKGVISGKTNKYNKDWIKTDAVVSYGNSGGASIDADGNVIGITSNSHSDLLGSLGYVINVTSINSWINSNKFSSPQASSLLDRTTNFAKMQNSLKFTNSFTNILPEYSIVKPSEWDYNYYSEGMLLIDKHSDDEGGQVIVSNFKFPYKVDTNSVEGRIKRTHMMLGLDSLASIIKNEDTNINGNSAKKVIVSSVGEQFNFYYIPHTNHLIEIVYDYGDNDKDKDIVDSIINSITLRNKDKKISEKSEYTHDSPRFSIKGQDGWLFMEQNFKDNPLMIANKNNKLFFADIEISKTDDNTKDLNNDEFLKLKEQEIKEGNSIAGILDKKVEMTESNAHFKLNNEINDIAMIKWVGKSISSGEIISQSIAYFVKSGDKYIVISMNCHSEDTSEFENVVDSFYKMASSFSLSGTSVDTKANPTNTNTNTEQTKAVKNTSMYNNLKGKIMLKVESNGEAYYIHPSTQNMYYLGRPDDAFSVMREQGVGISSDNLKKIQVGLGSLTGPDADGDGLPDLFEDAIGTDKNKPDTDGDGNDDKTELENSYNPNSTGKMYFDTTFAATHKGKIFLDVENNGEAWYVNPNDGKRYFLGRPADAFQVMRNLGLGISNENFDSL